MILKSGCHDRKYVRKAKHPKLFVELIIPIWIQTCHRDTTIHTWGDIVPYICCEDTNLHK